MDEDRSPVHSVRAHSSDFADGGGGRIRWRAIGAPPAFQAQRGSLGAEPKSLALTGNVFGRSGYYLLPSSAERVSKPVVANDIHPTDCNPAIRRPGFVTMHLAAIAGGTWVNAGDGQLPLPSSSGSGQERPAGRLFCGAGEI